MRHVLWACLCLVVSGLWLSAPAAEGTPSARTLAVSGTEVSVYPTFDPGILRYAATTTASTGGSLTVTTTPAGSGTVLVNGWPATSATTTVSGLTAGDEVSVIFDDAEGRTAYSVMYLPADFPALTASVDERVNEQPGLIAITPNAFNNSTFQPSFNAIVDRNGVPVYAVKTGPADGDLKRQPNGELTVARATTTPGRTGTALVTLDDQLADGVRREVAAPLINTDNHDSVRLPDGSTILLGYEPNGSTGKTDAVIQKLDPAGNQTFLWTSEPYLAESVMPSTNPDYAHINSVVSVANGDVIASLRHLSAVFRIATVAHDGYSPGDVIWKLGGRDSTFTFPDDPEGGPCAQHTASELPDGHILVFDNGTSAFGAAPSLCVDPANRSSGTYNRNFTRVAEYALDTNANTASLVWSYPSDHSRYTYFAGSARRLANGNTLIGWSVDMHALATEVNPSGQTIWELKAPTPPPGLRQYVTYRAEMIGDVPDKIAPVVTTSLGDNATYVVGDSVTPRFGCTDRGGSNLKTCTASASLDTSTAGSHVWQVTATDGAGNTTSISRHYSVRTLVGQPDSLIRKAGGKAWKGDGVYGAATGQTVRQGIHRRHTGTAFWRVQNDGESTDTLTLSGPRSSARFTVTYLDGTRDITRAVVAGRYRTPLLQPGQWSRVRVELTPTGRAPAGAHRTFTLRAQSLRSGVVDRAATEVTVRR